MNITTKGDGSISVTGTSLSFLNKSRKELDWFLTEIQKKYPHVLYLSKDQLKNTIVEKVHSEERQSAELAIIERFIQDYKTKVKKRKQV